MLDFLVVANLLPGRLFAVCGDGEFVIYTAQVGCAPGTCRSLRSETQCDARRSATSPTVLHWRPLPELAQLEEANY